MTIDEGTDSQTGKGTSVDFCIPLIPDSIRPFLVFDEGTIRVEDLAISISHQLRLPVIGKLSLQNAPLKMKLGVDGLLCDQQSLCEIVEMIKSAGMTKRVEWFLLSGDPEDDKYEVGPLAQKDFQFKNISDTAVTEPSALTASSSLPAARVVKQKKEEFDPGKETKSIVGEIEKILEGNKELRKKDYPESFGENILTKKQAQAIEKLEHAKQLKEQAKLMKQKKLEWNDAELENEEKEGNQSTGMIRLSRKFQPSVLLSTKKISFRASVKPKGSALFRNTEKKIEE